MRHQRVATLTNSVDTGRSPGQRPLVGTVKPTYYTAAGLSHPALTALAKRERHVQDHCRVRGRPGHGPLGRPPVRPGEVPGGLGARKQTRPDAFTGELAADGVKATGLPAASPTAMRCPA
jgi:hypothetical protein